MDKQSSISVIAWDLDNTLFDRDAAYLRFINAWLRRKGVRDDGDTTAGIMRLDRSGDGDRREFCRQAMRVAGLGTEAADELWEDTLRELPAFVEPDPRIEGALCALTRNFTMAVVSNGFGALQRAKLARSGVEPFIDPSLVIISGEVGCKKPDARIFEILLGRAGVPAERVLFAGDHLQNDIAGARAAGLRTCWIARGHERPADLAACLVLDHAWELQPDKLELLAPNAALA